MTLVDFILARLDDDEAAARDAALTVGWDGFGDQRIRSGQHWVASYHVVKRVRDDGPTDRRTVADGGSFAGMDTARHIARHDPARVLADVEAKRRIVERFAQGKAEWAAACEDYSDWAAGTPSRAGRATTSVSRDGLNELARVLRLLALPYADHPSFDPAWAVE